MGQPATAWCPTGFRKNRIYVLTIVFLDILSYPVQCAHPLNNILLRRHFFSQKQGFRCSPPTSPLLLPRPMHFCPTPKKRLTTCFVLEKPAVVSFFSTRRTPGKQPREKVEKVKMLETPRRNHLLTWRFCPVSPSVRCWTMLGCAHQITNAHQFAMNEIDDPSLLAEVPLLPGGRLEVAWGLGSELQIAALPPGEGGKTSASVVRWYVSYSHTVALYTSWSLRSASPFERQPDVGVGLLAC
jgi:hypothetical protein